MKYDEVKIMMINHIKDNIFVRNELRTLVNLLHDYNQLLRNFNVEPIESTSTLITMIEAEFGETVGFYQGIQKNQSWTVYDKTESDTLLDAALFSFGISDDLLFKNTAKRLSSKLKGSNDIDWPLSPNNLESLDESNVLLNKLLIWLKNPFEKDIEINVSPQISAISEILQGYITGKRTLFQTQLGITLHGLTRSKEIITLLHKFGLTISYKDTIDLESAWACHEREKILYAQKNFDMGTLELL